MADESISRTCAQCGGRAVVAYDQGGGQYLSFCLSHGREYQEMNLRTLEMLQEHRDRLEDDIADTWGLPRQPRPPRIPAAGVHVHNVNIAGNNLGVVNTGTVGHIENHLSVIQGQDAALAGQLKALTEAIIASNELNQTQKQEAADLLNEVTADIAKPLEQRRSMAVMRTMAVGLGQVLSHSADLLTLWEVVKTHLPF